MSDIQTMQAVTVDLDEITERAREAINSDLEGYIGRQWVSPEEVLALVQRVRELEGGLRWALDMADEELAKYGECAEAEESARLREGLL
jgi:hypothetical protein